MAGGMEPMRIAAREPDLVSPVLVTVMQRARRWLRLALAALVLGLVLSPAPSFAAGNPYNRYNTLILISYLYGDISPETVIRLWLGVKPTKQEVEGAAYLVQLAMILDQPSIRAGATGATGSYTLSSSTPILPFAGNQLVVAGAVPFANDTNLSAVAFPPARRLHSG